MAITKFTLNFIILIIAFITGCDAQDFNIKSLDGTHQKIRVIADYPNNTLSIICLKDTIRVNEFMDLPGGITILNDCFLKVVYECRAGSGESLEQLLLLCIKNNKFCQSMNVNSLSRYDVNTVFNKRADSLKLFDEHGLYDLKLKIEGNSNKTYKSDIFIHDESISKRAPITNHRYDKIFVLNFDSTQNIFYNAYENISEYFTIYNPKHQKTSRQYVLGRFPAIQFGKIKYYYIRGCWYGRGQKDYLYKYSY